MEETKVITDRQGLEVLTPEECWRLLGEADVGRVAFVDAGEAVILPVNHVVVDHTIAFLTASGSKLGAAMMADPVSFEVDGFVAATRSGWSVLVRGVAEPVYDERALATLRATELQPWAQGIARHHWVRINVNEVSGRRLV